MENTTGVLLLNLGGPDSLNAVRPFLYNLFSDRDIIQLGPAAMQKPLAWLLSTLRSAKSRKMYSLIGGKSPILDITKAQAEALEKALNEQSAQETPKETCFKVYIGMRYWHPYIKETFDCILNDKVTSLIVLSLYPHYSKTTTGSAVNELKRISSLSDLKVDYIEQWYDYEPYIDSLSSLVFEGVKEFQDPGVSILYSAHNLPVSFINEGDPYLNHIKSTIHEINHRLGRPPYNLSPLRWELAFQSKSGPVEWLKPASEEMIRKLARNGCSNLLIVPVSFVSDHIETLYEIDILFREIADSHGIHMKRCRSLNTDGRFIAALRDLVLSKIK